MPRLRAAPCSIGVGAALFVTSTVVGVGQSPGLADVTTVEGSAYGYFASVSLFQGPANTRGPAPTVALAADASNSPQIGSAETGSVTFGPATLFSSGPIALSTQGTLGAGGTVITTATIQNVNTSGQEVFTATSIASTCTATEGTAPSGSTAVAGGRLVTSEGNPDVEGDETIVDIPANPAPNTSFNGTIESVGDSFRYVFNEQVVTGSTITVNAAHLYLLGPTAVGDLIIGQSVCGVTATGEPTTTTTIGPTTTTTIGATTTTTTDPSATTTTSTTIPATTTTTRATAVQGVSGSQGSPGNTATPAAGGILARTGGKAGWKLGLGIGLFTVGMSSTLLARRRRPAPPA